MFLLLVVASYVFKFTFVFVSYIRRYVLTPAAQSEQKKRNDCVFVSYIRRYVLTIITMILIGNIWAVFVSYIRRYVLTRTWKNKDSNINYRFRLLYSEICSYFLLEVNDMWCIYGFRLLYSEICSYLKNHCLIKQVRFVFVSYIRRYVLTRTN